MMISQCRRFAQSAGFLFAILCVGHCDEFCFLRVPRTDLVCRSDRCELPSKCFCRAFAFLAPPNDMLHPIDMLCKFVFSMPTLDASFDFDKSFICCVNVPFQCRRFIPTFGAHCCARVTPLRGARPRAPPRQAKPSGFPGWSGMRCRT